ncbi:Hyoscyamine 6-dioxygenase [Morella rubra]|uniref:Hyoscyamine 6-dioxygenase n=1 Tax=Morella rubra TaxID=262757 RepID=A0A6A1UUT6_9ROSI|nr:Hyoscyamine 6-dioxygenase [Morella rubra]
MEVAGESSCSFSTGKSAQERVIDLAGLRQGSAQRSIVIQEIGNACHRVGFFQIINHGICQEVLDGALSAAFDFFNLPTAEKVKFMSDDVHKPVWYWVDEVQFRRVFLKHYAHPLEDWIDLWPTNPPTYREKMGKKYDKEVRKLGLELMGTITESLGLGPAYLSNEMGEGMQAMAINCYPGAQNRIVYLGCLHIRTAAA